MGLTTVAFFAFLVAVSIACRLSPVRLRPWLLAAASYGYYCTWSVNGALLLFGVTVAVFVAGRAIGITKSGHARFGVLLGALAGLLALLIFFKLAPVLATALEYPVWVPLGVSYYTFKLISYLLDVYWGTAAAETSFISFAAYVAFFPQIVAGPIQRSSSFLAQVHKLPPPRWVNVMWGIQRILLGCFKKFLVADNLAILVDFVYGQAHASGTPLILGFYFYPLQIYADFSGLADIAIGAAWMVGIDSPENFNAPFSAPSPSEFWRRWHITLTTLLTDYVFTPLRMALRDRNNVGLVASLFLTMTLIGLWHGFRWTYALFGVIHGFYLSIDALTLRIRKRFFKTHRAADRLADWVGPLVTFHLMALAFVFFRGDTVAEALYVLQHIPAVAGRISPTFSTLIDGQGRVILIGCAGYLIMEAADYLRRHAKQGDSIRLMHPWGRWAVYYATTVLAIAMILLMMGIQVNRTTFVYAMF